MRSSAETTVRGLRTANGASEPSPLARDAGAATRNWRALWLSLGGLAALAVTIVDAILLQTKFNFFTGGFLSADHLQGGLQTALYLLVSLIADAGITLPLAALATWLLAIARLRAVPSIVAVVAVAAAPLLVADFFFYRLHEFLGDAFDLALSYEIAGRDTTEMLVVAAAHLKAPLLMLLGVLLLLAVVIWLLKHVIPGGWTALPRAPATGRLVLENIGILALALVAVCLAAANSDSLAFGLERKPAGKLLSQIGDSLSDFDRDGYGMVRRPRDPASFDARIYPYAIDRPGNDVDENGTAGDAVAGGPVETTRPVSPAPWKSRPNVVWFVLESFRADLLGADYQGKPVTPVLNRLAREGISASAAYSHNGYTTTSRYHMFTGALGYVANHPSLIDDFKAQGYQVAFFSAQDESFGDRKLDVGFARSDVAYDARNNPELRYTAFTTAGSIALPSEVMVAKIGAFLAQRRDDRPLLLHVNLQDAHFAYHHARIRPLLNDVALPRSRIDADHAAELRATYQNTAANVDHAVGQIIDAVKRRLNDPRPGIIVLADHGESLFDDKFLGHGQAINDVQLRIPLIVANLPMVVDEPFGQAHLRGALLDALETADAANRAPRLVSSGRAEVLQYIGDLTRPRQIGIRSSTGLVQYDFRTHRMRISEGAWRPPEALAPDEQDRFRELINRWEALAQRTAEAQRKARALAPPS
jgi:hypothetical protein